MPTLDVKVLVVREKEKYCAFAYTTQNDEDFQVGDSDVSGARACEKTRSKAIGGALRNFGTWLTKTKPFGGLGAMRCKAFTKAALRKGTRIEHREHPEFAASTARKIARDHLCRNPKAYAKER